MIYEFNASIGKLDELRAQAQVLTAVLRAARTELGGERANELILGAVREWARERMRLLGERTPGSRREKFDAIKALDDTRYRDGDIAFEVLRWDPEAIEYDVSHCAFAELFCGLGEPALGEALVCDADHYLVEQVTGPDVTYARPQCIMRGSPTCQTRWRIAPGGK